jgi:hypothetical protein
VADTIQLPPTSIEEFTLANGLRVVFSPDHAMPVVSVAVYYDVGSRNEREGRTGFAHLFEHMMFQGSENVPKAAHFQYIFNAGGTMNGTTSTERTNYFETLPSNYLPLAFWLESDRMRSLKVTQENLDNQRHAVQEEKRLRYDNQPYVNAFLLINELIFKNPANAHSTIGSMEDLDAATIDDVREFFRIYYAPNNAVLSVVGDFDSAEARELIDKYFGNHCRRRLTFLNLTQSPCSKRYFTIHLLQRRRLFLVGKFRPGALRIFMRYRWRAHCCLMETVRDFIKSSLRAMNRWSRLKVVLTNAVVHRRCTFSRYQNLVRKWRRFAGTSLKRSSASRRMVQPRTKWRSCAIRFPTMRYADDSRPCTGRNGWRSLHFMMRIRASSIRSWNTT